MFRVEGRAEVESKREQRIVARKEPREEIKIQGYE